MNAFLKNADAAGLAAHLKAHPQDVDGYNAETYQLLQMKQTLLYMAVVLACKPSAKAQAVVDAVLASHPKSINYTTEAGSALDVAFMSTPANEQLISSLIAAGADATTALKEAKEAQADAKAIALKAIAARAAAKQAAPAAAAATAGASTAAASTAGVAAPAAAVRASAAAPAAASGAAKLA